MKSLLVSSVIILSLASTGLALGAQSSSLKDTSSDAAYSTNTSKDPAASGNMTTLKVINQADKDVKIKAGKHDFKLTTGAMKRVSIPSSEISRIKWSAGAFKNGTCNTASLSMQRTPKEVRLIVRTSSSGNFTCDEANTSGPQKGM